MSDNSWFARGELPPVDTICEHYDADGWQKCRVLAIDSRGLLVVELFEDGIIAHSNDNGCYTFRPIKSEREKFGLQLYRAVNYNSDDITDEVIMSFRRFEDYCKPYDAGFRAPE